MMNQPDRVAFRQQLRGEAMSTVIPADDPPGSGEDYRRTFAVLKEKGVSLARALEYIVLNPERPGKFDDQEIVDIAREIYGHDRKGE